MALTPRLEQRQTQSLVMTPQLQQAIKLLQLSNLDLMEYVEREIAENPLLEREDGEPAGALDGAPDEAGFGGEEPGAGGGDAEAGEAEALAAIDFTAEPGTAERPLDGGLDLDYENLYNNDSDADLGPAGGMEPAFADAGRGRGGSFDDRESSLEATLSERPSLRAHLIAQLSVDVADPVDRLIGLQLIDMLDEAGYIRGDPSQVAALLNCPLERVEATLARLQEFDPAGAFARNLAECLALQLRDRDRLDPAMQTLLAHLDLLAKREFEALTRICGVDREDLAGMIAEIKALDPKPALVFESTVAQPITPDVLMRAQAGGGWVVELNAESLPRVLVNNQYYARIHRATHTRDDRQYIAEKLQSANWLVKSLHQRATTILKVATEIVRQQHAFFVHGVQFLKPLVLRDIAAAIEMHESTVSRVTSNKYMATPRGIYELKYFFTPSIGSSTGGSAHSAESVRHRVKALIGGEPPERVLSDDGIVEILKVEGVDIARRTVAKYRESLGIPSSVQRRRENARAFPRT